MSLEDTMRRAEELLNRIRRSAAEGNEREACDNAFRLATLVVQEAPRIALTLGRDLTPDLDLLSQSIVLRMEQIREHGLNARECLEIAEMAWRLLERVASGTGEQRS